MVNIVQIIQIQQARVIFNPLNDIFTKRFSYCFILIILPLQDLNFIGKELRSSWRILKNDFLNMPVSCERQHVDFLGILHGIPVNSEYSQELCQRMNNVNLCGHLPHFLSSKIDPSIRYIASAKIFPALSLCQKN